MLKDSQPTLPQGDNNLRLLAFAVAGGSALIFAGLVLVAFSVLAADAGGAALSVLSDRRIHYALIAVIVAYYVYLQRR